MLVRDVKKDSGFIFGMKMDERMRAIFAERGIKPTNLLEFERVFRYEEGVLEIGGEVAVKGIGNWKKWEHKPVLTLFDYGKHALKISNHPDTLTQWSIFIT